MVIKALDSNQPHRASLTSLGKQESIFPLLNWGNDISALKKRYPVAQYSSEGQGNIQIISLPHNANYQLLVRRIIGAEHINNGYIESS
jgi:hypothetical protein